MGQTGSKLTAQGQVESSINDTINFIMAKVAAGEIDAATATELIAAARKDYEGQKLKNCTTSASSSMTRHELVNTAPCSTQRLSWKISSTLRQVSSYRLISIYKHQRLISHNRIIPYTDYVVLD